MKQQMRLASHIKRLIVLTLSLVIALGALPFSLIAKAVTEDSVGKSGFNFDYNALDYSDLVELEGQTIFKAESESNGVRYEYLCKVERLAVNQNRVIINKYQSKNGVELSFGDIIATYFKNGSANLEQEDFSLREAVITAIYNYDVFRKGFSAGYTSINHVNAFDKTNVLDDLVSAGVDLMEYPYDLWGDVKTPSIINFIEFGYSNNPDMQDYYSLYVYFYNPQNVSIDATNLSNRIQLASEYSAYPITADTTPTSYDTFELMFCSKSEGDYDGLFYKFKILDHKGDDGKTIQERVNSAERRYDVSGIVLYDKLGNGVEYTVGGSYRFSGYAKGFGADSESTLTNTGYLPLETIRLDVMLTTYVQDQPNSLGQGCYNSISSAYFSIPNKFLTNQNGELTGNLQKVHIEWWEYKTRPIVFTTEDLIHNAYQNNPGLHTPFNTSLGFDKYYNISPNDSDLIDWLKNMKDSVNYNPVFLSYKLSTLNEKILLKGSDLREDVLNYNKTANKGYLPVKDGSISADLFLESVDAGRAKGYNNKTIDANDKYNLLVNNANWLQTLFGEKYLNEVEIDRAIYPITLSDLEYEKSEFCDKFYVGENDFDLIKTSASNAKSANETPYLLRFASTVFEKCDISYAHDYGVNIEHVSKAVSETVFFDFKFIDLTFEVEGEYKTVPVVQDPIDHFPDIKNKNYYGDKEPPFWTLLFVIVAGIVAILAVVIELKILGLCLTKKASITLIVIGFILLITFGILDYLFVDWVINLLAGYGGIWLP